jgi:glycosyltransferase involved in cell wall biosynthesis
MPAEKPDFLVSIIIPAYNAARFIRFTLESLIRQSHENLEIIVIDDGSTDNTLEIAGGYSVTDDRITILKQKNLGVAAARNRGIKCARGIFVAFVDADDIWHPTAVAKMLNCFKRSSSNLAVVYAWSLDIDSNNFPTGGVHVSRARGYVHPLLICHNFIGNASSTMIRATHLRSIDGYRTEFNIGCEDLDLYLRLAEKFDYDFVPEYLVAYRKSTESMSSNTFKLNQSHTQVIDKLRVEHPSTPPLLLRLSKINFYAYLAHSADSDQSNHNSFYWIRKSLKTDVFLSLLRLDILYIVFARLWRLAFRQNKCEKPDPMRRSILERVQNGDYSSSFRPPAPSYLLSTLKIFLGSGMLFLLRRLT